jgi:tRNA(fMet)-specific endonuclease VapC
VLGELRTGFHSGSLTRQNERILVRFLDSPRVRLLLPDEQTTFHYASLFAQLRQQATPIPTNDLWIAALVIQHDLTLLTRDEHFEQLPQLSRI